MPPSEQERDPERGEHHLEDDASDVDCWHSRALDHVCARRSGIEAEASAASGDASGRVVSLAAATTASNLRLALS